MKLALHTRGNIIRLLVQVQRNGSLGNIIFDTISAEIYKVGILYTYSLMLAFYSFK